VAYYAKYRFQKQIIRGVQPYEFVRASSVHYLTFNTAALTKLSVLTSTMGVDTWRNGLRHGFSLKDAYDYAIPHVLTRAAYWPYKQGNDEFDFDRFAEVFGELYRGLSGSGLGPYSYLVTNRVLWTSKDFLARFQGNFWQAVRPSTPVVEFVIHPLQGCRRQTGARDVSIPMCGSLLQ
jgi:hypothetical protein